MIRPAKQTFVTSALREPMEKISSSEPFLVACDYSLLMLIEEINNPLDPSSAAAIVGAKRVLDILKTIAEKETPAAKAPWPSLRPQ